METGSTYVFLVACEDNCFSPIFGRRDRKLVDSFVQTADFFFLVGHRLAQTLRAV